MIKSVAIIGLGAVGSMVLPEFTRILGHENVYAIASDERAERLKRDGIYINGKHFLPNVVSPSVEGKPADLIILAVKSSALSQAIKDMANQVGKETIIMSLMNGIDSEPKLIEAFGAEHVVYGLTTINTSYREGEVEFSFDVGEIKFGNAENDSVQLHQRIEKIKKLFDKTDIPYQIPQNMIHELWKKFLFNASANSIAAVLHARHRYFQNIPSAVTAKALVIDEIMEVANAVGAELTDDDARFYKNIPWEWEPEGRCSMVQDIEGGRISENEMFLGSILDMAREHHLKIPACELLYLLINTIDEANKMTWREHQAT